MDGKLEWTISNLVTALPTHFFFYFKLHDRDCCWIWGMDLSPRRCNYCPWRWRLVPGPVIVPLRIGQAFKVWKFRWRLASSVRWARFRSIVWGTRAIQLAAWHFWCGQIQRQLPVWGSESCIQVPHPFGPASKKIRWLRPWFGRGFNGSEALVVFWVHAEIQNQPTGNSSWLMQNPSTILHNVNIELTRYSRYMGPLKLFLNTWHLLYHNGPRMDIEKSPGLRPTWI
jgi:hypothetical protein